MPWTDKQRAYWNSILADAGLDGEADPEPYEPRRWVAVFRDEAENLGYQVLSFSSYTQLKAFANSSVHDGHNVYQATDTTPDEACWHLEHVHDIQDGIEYLVRQEYVFLGPVESLYDAPNPAQEAA